MARLQTIDSIDTQTPSPAPLQRNNILAFPTARARLQVTLSSAAHVAADNPLRALLHSPLGVYVADIETVRDEIRVQLDIAPDDLDFTLHTLISTVPCALIGALKRRSIGAKAH